MSAAKKTYQVICPRCDGAGRYCGGTCFLCHGSHIRKMKTKPNQPLQVVRVRNGEKYVDYHVYDNSLEKVIKVLRLCGVIKGERIK